jgi:hypothetical protein
MVTNTTLPKMLGANSDRLARGMPLSFRVHVPNFTSQQVIQNAIVPLTGSSQAVNSSRQRIHVVRQPIHVGCQPIYVGCQPINIRCISSCQAGDFSSHLTEGKHQSFKTAYAFFKVVAGLCAGHGWQLANKYGV